MNETEKFFGGLPQEDVEEKVNIFDEKPTEVATDKVEEKIPEKDTTKEPYKNRRHRRLEEQLEKEREARIRAEERAAAIAESRTTDTPTEVPAEWVALYGDTPEAQKAWKLTSKLIQEGEERAAKRAVDELTQKQIESQKQEKQFESFIDTQLENLEDEFSIDLTSNAPVAKKNRREFLELVQSVSPKDEQGNITAYADFRTTFDIYQKTKSVDKPGTIQRQKEIAGRSMQTSGQTTGEKQSTPGFFGWKRDFGLN